MYIAKNTEEEKSALDNEIKRLRKVGNQVDRKRQIFDRKEEKLL